MKKKGFTLIEVLMACFIIIVGVIASYIIVQQIFAQTFNASSRLTAIYLAQEGSEIIRNVRDTGWIQGLDWNNNNLSVGYWEADYLGSALVSCALCDGTDSDFNRLRFLKTQDPFYNYSAGDNTPFKRRIRIERPAGDSIKVTVDTMWRHRGQFRKVTIQSFLYDWNR